MPAEAIFRMSKRPRGTAKGSAPKASPCTPVRTSVTSVIRTSVSYVPASPRSSSFIDLVCEVVPDQVTLVPDAHDAITSNAGWDTVANREFLTDVCALFKSKGIRTSIFIDPDPRMAEGAAECGADRVELYTAGYAERFPQGPEAAVADYLRTAERVRELGLGLNAGHDLNLDNLEYFIRTIPWTDEVSIGHALISDALYMGLEKTIGAYLSKIKIF